MAEAFEPLYFYLVTRIAAAGKKIEGKNAVRYPSSRVYLKE